MDYFRNNYDLGMFDEELRRATYKNWAFKQNKPCSADKMAEAGFVFTGSSREPDSVACFFCAKPLDGWTATDDPWSEHLQHAADCDFAKMQKKQEDWTVGQYLDVWEKYQELLSRKKFGDAKKRIKKQFDLCRKALDY